MVTIPTSRFPFHPSRFHPLTPPLFHLAQIVPSPVNTGRNRIFESSHDTRLASKNVSNHCIYRLFLIFDLFFETHFSPASNRPKAGRYRAKPHFQIVPRHTLGFKNLSRPLYLQAFPDFRSIFRNPFSTRFKSSQGRWMA